MSPCQTETAVTVWARHSAAEPFAPHSETSLSVLGCEAVASHGHNGKQRRNEPGLTQSKEAEFKETTVCLLRFTAYFLTQPLDRAGI